MDPIARPVTIKSEENQHNDLSSLLIDDARYHLGDRPFGPESKKISEALRSKSSDQSTLLYAYKDQAKTLTDARALYLDYPDRDIEDFILIYKTDAKKENPIHALDEDDECKPFWAGIFNTPHRLINALLNLADVGTDKEVVDPFSYSGTVAIEAAKLGAFAQSFDISEVRGAQDNFEFFCTMAVAGKKTLGDVSAILDDERRTSVLQELAKARSRVNELQMPDVEANNRIERLMNERKDLLGCREGRIAYYLLRRHNMEQQRGVKGVDKIGIDPVQYAKGQLDRLRQAIDYVAALERHHKKGERLCLVPGKDVTESHCRDHNHKSNRVFLSYEISKTARRSFLFRSHDITKESLPVEEQSVDAVVTDPPYGYGDLLDRDELFQVYTAFFDQAIRILKNGGSLVFCALDKVRTGRSTKNLFTTEEVIRMLHDAACNHGVDFAFPSIDPVAQQTRGLNFWKSTKALNRSIFAARIYRR